MNPVQVRLRKRLQQKNESLANQFEFCIYVAFVLKPPGKVVLYKSTDVMVLMNNQLEKDIRNSKRFDDEEALHDHLLEDNVQLHVSKYSNVNNGHLSSSSDLNFLLWPRPDLDHVTCVLLSRWRNTIGPFRCLETTFRLSSECLKNQIAENQNELKFEDKILVGEERLFLALDQMKRNNKKQLCYITKQLCLFVPQVVLTSWTALTEKDVIDSFSVQAASK